GVADQEGDVGQAGPAVRDVAERQLAADVLDERLERDTLLAEPALERADAQPEPPRHAFDPETAVADRGRDRAPDLVQPCVRRLGLRQQLVQVALDDREEPAVGAAYGPFHVGGIEDDSDVYRLPEPDRGPEDALELGHVPGTVMREEHAARVPVGADESTHEPESEDRRPF